MSLSSALTTAIAGLQVNQAALSIVSSNVANAKTPGYVTQSLNQIEVAGGTTGSTVRTTGVNRQLDQYIQSQLRTESAGNGYATQIANSLSQLQTTYGTPGAAGTLETTFTNFTTALQGITTSSSSQSAQAAALAAAQSFAQQLNSTSQSIQSLRSNADQDIGTSVGQANTALTVIANINSQLQGLSPTDPTAATLQDQRDSAIDQLSQLVDIRVTTDNNNQASVYTTSGVQLVGVQASQFQYTSKGDLNATSLWNADPTKNGVGTLTIKLPNGSSTDLVATNSLASGRIAADIQLRDKTLVQAQSQLDQLAATLSSSLSDVTTNGTAATSGAKSGFDLALPSSLLPGNTVNLTYTDTSTGIQHKLSIVSVSDPSALPLSNTATNDPNDTVIGIDFSGGIASAVSQLNTALGTTHLQFSNPSGSTLRVLDDGSSAATLNAASTTTTASSLANGALQLPVFTDGNILYTGAITGLGSQLTGLASRITVNPALAADASKFQVYNTSPATAAGDTSRSDFLYSQLTSGVFSYSPQTGLGSAAAPFKGTITSYLQQFLSVQSNAASNATSLQQGQAVVVNNLQQKFNSTSGVNIDTELSNLISLQNSYAANAHVLSTIQTMMNTLMQVQP
jgi:flagellar hook-associated protein 1 FlgK